MRSNRITNIFKALTIYFVWLSFAVNEAGVIRGQQSHKKQIEENIKKQISENIERLRGKDERARRTAIYSLMRLSPESVSSLVEVLNDKSSCDLARAGAAESLGMVGEEAVDAIEPLKNALLPDNDARVRYMAAYAFDQLFTDPGMREAISVQVKVDVVKALENNLDEERETLVRHFSARALGSLGVDSQGAVPKLLERLKKEKDPVVRYQIAAALGQIGQECGQIGTYPHQADKVVSCLREKLVSESDPFAKQGMAQGLGGFGEKAVVAVEDLRKALVDPNENELVAAEAARSLGEIGPWLDKKTRADAVVTGLLTALEGNRPDRFNNISPNAAEALAKIGERKGWLGADVSQAIISGLTKALDDAREEVPRAAAKALGDLAGSLKHKARELPIRDLEQVINSLNRALDKIDKTGLEGKERLSNELEGITKIRDERFIDRFFRWAADNRWVTVPIAIIVMWVLLYVSWILLLLLRPLWLLHINETLAYIEKLPMPKKFEESGIRCLRLLCGGVGFFHYHRHVLDAWVAVRLNRVRNHFYNNNTVKDREIYVPSPVKFANNGTKIVTELTTEELQPAMREQKALVLISGEGGAGKTTIACLIARWALGTKESAKRNKPPFGHWMLPVLIQNELIERGQEVERGRDYFRERIRGLLQAYTHDTDPIPDELFEHLLKHQRLLVIVDHFSEMSERSRAAIRPNDPMFPVNALIVTSRVEETLGDVPKTILQPLRIQADNLFPFLDAYLIKRAKRDKFDDESYKETRNGLSALVGNRPVTLLLAKMYIDLATKRREAVIKGEQAPELPTNIPMMMRDLLVNLNRDRSVDDPDDHTVMADAMVIAWECLQRTYQSSNTSKSHVLETLKTINGNGSVAPEVRLRYLEKRLQIVETIPAISALEEIRFTLDPLAEYLAGWQLLTLNGNWNEFVNQADELISEAGDEADKAGKGHEGVERAKQRKSELIRGFLLAVRDCCSARLAVQGIPPNERNTLKTVVQNIERRVSSRA